MGYINIMNKFLKFTMAFMLMAFSFGASQASADKPHIKIPKEAAAPFRVIKFCVFVSQFDAAGHFTHATGYYEVTYTIGGGFVYQAVAQCSNGNNMIISYATKGVNEDIEATLKRCVCEYFIANPDPAYETQPCP